MASPGDLVVSLADRAIGIAERSGRSEIARGLRLTRDRAARRTAVIAVVGEFKRGKSRLINAMVGADACPVADDLSTAVLTMVHAGTGPPLLYQPDGESVRANPASREVFAKAVSEAGNPGNELGIHLAEVSVTSAVLDRGMALLDTPGVGGAGRGYAAVIRGFLAAADAAVFVTDASAELNAGEIEFIGEVQAAVPIIVLAVTKIDNYVDWRRIAELDRAHLERAGLGDLALCPVSAALREAAIERRLPHLNAESGFPDLLAALDARVLGPERGAAARRAAHDIASAVAQLAAELETELRALRDPEEAARARTELESAQASLRALREAGARWQVALNEGIGDVRTECGHELRRKLRDLQGRVEKRIDDADPARDGPSIGEQLQVEGAATAAEVATRLTEEAAAVEGRVAGLLRASVPATIAGRSSAGGDWSVGSLVTPEAGRQMLHTGLGLVKGAQGGAFMIAFFGSVVGLTVALPVALAVGSLFGVRQVGEERRRRLEGRRAQAKVAVRQALDRLQFEAGAQIDREAVRLQREIRARYEEWLEQAMKRAAASIAGFTEALEQAEHGRTDRAQAVETLLGEARDVRSRLAELAT